MPAPPSPAKAPAAAPAAAPSKQLSRSELAAQRNNTAISNNQAPIDLGDVDKPGFNSVDLGDVDKPGFNSSKTNTSNNAVGRSIPSVIAMQKEMVQVAKDISDHAINKANRDTKNQKGETLGGADPFSSFLVKQYMGKSSIKGQTYPNTTVSQPSRNDTAGENENFTAVLNTISRIGRGAQGQEQTPDGDWGSRTTNALKQIYALAYALVNMQKDMGVDNETYKESDLTTFGNLVATASNPMNDQQKDQTAKAVIPELEKFRKFYVSFKEKVLDDKDTQALITQQKPFSSKQGDENKNQVDQKIQALYESNKNTPVQITLNNKRTQIAPANLQSMSALKAYLKSISPEVVSAEELTQPEKIKNLISQINSQLAGI